MGFFTGEQKNLKFYVWGRKIKDEVSILKHSGASFADIRDYLEICAEKRREVLDAHDLTLTEYDYTIEIHKIFDEYMVVDEIYEKIK